MPGLSRSSTPDGGAGLASLIFPLTSDGMTQVRDALWLWMQVEEVVVQSCRPEPSQGEHPVSSRSRLVLSRLLAVPGTWKCGLFSSLILFHGT